MQDINYCLYYQANVLKEKTWLFTAMLRAHEHLAFDRTLDVTGGLFEFFVPVYNESAFLKLITTFIELGIVKNLVKLDNRLHKESGS